MNTAEGIPSTQDTTPDDGEPPSPGSMRSWENDWNVDPFAVDNTYVAGLEQLKLLEGRTEEDIRRDAEAIALAAIRRRQEEERFFHPLKEPKPMTGPQRVGVAIRKLFKTESRIV